MKTIHQITLYNLMAYDHYVWVDKNKISGYDLHIEDDEGDVIIEKGIHPFAMESLADFCNRFLRIYEKQKAKLENVA